MLRSILRDAAQRLGYTVHSGPCESSYTRSFGDLLNRLQPTHLLDVGGALGEYSQTARNLGYRGQIHSFEPIPENRVHLEARSAGDPLWHVHPFAIGDRDEAAEMNRITGWSCHSLYDLNDTGKAAHGGLQVEERVPVEIRRLDTLWPPILPSDARVWLKTDTEGHDLAVLDGVGERIRSVVALAIEMQIRPVHAGVPLFADVLARVQALGFEPFAFDPVVSDERGRIMAMDGLFVRPDAL